MACNLYSLYSTEPCTLIYTNCDGVNTPVSIPAETTYYFCATEIVSSPCEVVDLGPCDCNCYYVLDQGNGIPNIYIVDCDINPTTLTGPFYTNDRFCATFFDKISLGVPDPTILIGKSDNTCSLTEGYNCDYPNVKCYTISPDPMDPTARVFIYYIDSLGNIVKIDSNGESVSFCATAIITECYLFDGSTANCVQGIVTQNGDCVVNEVSGEYLCPQTCNCYYFFTTEGDLPLTIDYIDCSGNGITTEITTAGFNKICAQYINMVNPRISCYNSGIECVDNKCPNYCCKCYTVSNLTVFNYDLTYLNCDLQLTTITLGKVNTPSGTVQICALNVPPDESNISIALNGPCYNGQCVTSTEDLLIYDVLTNSSPCPDLCCGDKGSGAKLSNDPGNTLGSYSII